MNIKTCPLCRESFKDINVRGMYCGDCGKAIRAYKAMVALCRTKDIPFSRVMKLCEQPMDFNGYFTIEEN